jgi:glucosamine--fructose-6-phosphate aminotransferase (isomerizing)
MCGITAYLGNGSAFEFILESLRLLQNRGYDSAGIATLDSLNTLLVDKFASILDKSAIESLSASAISEKHLKNTIGIGHTRWATHGAKTDTNAHPHTDSKLNFAVVHNGIIENYLSIKNWLISKGIHFVSQTDTEVIPKLLEYYYEVELKSDKSDFENNVLKKAISHLEGTWAIVVMFKETSNTLYLSKNGSPLVIGYSNDFALIASEQLPLSVYFNNYITLNDGDTISISKDEDGSIIIPCKSYIPKTIENKVIELSPAPYAHWTLKEIFEQQQSIQRTLNMGGRILDDYHVKLGGLDSKKELLIECDNIILLGCGTSLNAANIGTHILKSFKCFDFISAIDASEFCLEDIPMKGKTAFVLLSQSGETKDLHRCIEMIRHTDYPTIGIVNVVGSLIARETDCGIYLNAGREVGVASTKSFTSQIIALSLLAIWFSQNYGCSKHNRARYIRNLKSLSTDVESLICSTEDVIKKLAATISHTKNMFILGRGMLKSVADEAALKIKEISYIHAEGYAGGALKHGPFALLDKDVVVILIAPMDDNFSKMMNAAEEIYSRHAKIILITNYSASQKLKNDLFNEIIYIPENLDFQTILSIIPLQLLAYELSLAKDLNPDFPRNLAKVVTVDG